MYTQKEMESKTQTKDIYVCHVKKYNVDNKIMYKCGVVPKVGPELAGKLHGKYGYNEFAWLWREVRDADLVIDQAFKKLNGDTSEGFITCDIKTLKATIDDIIKKLK